MVLNRATISRVMILALLMTSGLAGAENVSRLPPIPVIQCGQILNVAGGEYVVGPGFVGCPSIAGPVTIAANHVHLNMAGGFISSIGAALAINDGVSDILIDGGGQLGGGGGLVIGKARHVVVRNVTLQGEDDLGGPRTGVQINGAQDVSLIGCTIYGFEAIAAQMNGATHVTMIDNNVAGTFGIFGTVDRGVFANNSVTISADVSVHGRGIALTGRANLVANNSLTLPGPGSPPNHDDIGIIVTSHSQVRGNIVNQFFVGVELAGDFNEVVGNLITGRSMGLVPLSVNGIETDAGATHNSIHRNVVSSNQADLYESNGPPCINIWRKNVFQTSGGATSCIH